MSLLDPKVTCNCCGREVSKHVTRVCPDCVKEHGDRLSRRDRKTGQPVCSYYRARSAAFTDRIRAGEVRKVDPAAKRRAEQAVWG